MDLVSSSINSELSRYIGKYSPDIEEYKRNCSLFELPDELLWWTLSVLRGKPVSVPFCTDQIWTLWLDLLNSHYSAPLIWFKCESFLEDGLPPVWVRKKLQSSYRQSSYRSILVSNQVSELVSVLRREEINPVILKGSALGHQVYPYPALRYGCDIDILVKPEEVIKTIEILSRHGYHPQRDIKKMSMLAFHHIVLIPCDRKKYLSLEIHWRLLYLPGEITPSLHDILNRSVDIQGSYDVFRCLDIPDALLFGSTHMCIGHSNAVRLSWIADIAYLSESLSIQRRWDELFIISKNGIALEMVKKACFESGFWFGPDESLKPDFFPDPVPGSFQVISDLSSVIGRSERHLMHVFREAPYFSEGFRGILQILLMTQEIEWGAPSLHGKIRAFEIWIRILMNILRRRVHLFFSEKIK